MAESRSGNSNSEFVLKPREEEHLLNATERKKKSKKRKNKDIEENKSNVTRLLYNETPSDQEESESVVPSPKKVKPPPFSKVWSDQDEISILRGMNEKKSKKRKNKDIEENKSNVTRLLYNETPSDQEESESVVPSPKKVKPPPFSKVWSDQDEISILRGMIEFKDQTGRHAEQNMVEFRAFILQSLIRQATLIQLREKIRRLKDKYEKSLEKGNGGRTQHKVELYQLCQKIWTEQHNSSGSRQQKQQNIIGHQNIRVKEKPNIPEKQHIPESGRARQLIIEQHKIIPVTGPDRQTLDALWKRVSNDIELVVNSKPCLRGNQKEVDLRVLDLCSQSTELRIKLCKLVMEKAISPELRDFPEVLEQEVLRAYLEAKIEHAQLLLNAYNSFIKDHADEAQSSVSAINK